MGSLEVLKDENGGLFDAIDRLLEDALLRGWHSTGLTGRGE